MQVIHVTPEQLAALLEQAEPAHEEPPADRSRRAYWRIPAASIGDHYTTHDLDTGREIAHAPSFAELMDALHARGFRPDQIAHCPIRYGIL